MSGGFEVWNVGQVRITRVIEQEFDLPPHVLFGTVSNERVLETMWLQPHYAHSDGTLRVSFHAFVLESEGRRIVIDTCGGNDKQRTFPPVNLQNHPFLERLSQAGFPTESIDYVLCTHMHVDHVGWNTRWDGSRWVPTFPNAQYLFARVEWEHWRQEEAAAGDVAPPVVGILEANNVVADSVIPVIDAGLARFVEMDHRISGEVTLIPTPGHTPGHVSVAIASAGQKALIMGDVIHHPVQLSDPDIGAVFDYDRKQARETRLAVLSDHADKDVLVLGTHFATPSVGQIVSDSTAWRFVPLKGDAT